MSLLVLGRTLNVAFHIVGENASKLCPRRGTAWKNRNKVKLPSNEVFGITVTWMTKNKPPNFMITSGNILQTSICFAAYHGEVGWLVELGNEEGRKEGSRVQERRLHEEPSLSQNAANIIFDFLKAAAAKSCIDLMVNVLVLKYFFLLQASVGFFPRTLRWKHRGTSRFSVLPKEPLIEPESHQQPAS